MRKRCVSPVGWVGIIVFVCAVLLAGPATRADKLDALFAQIVLDPGNVELNFEYAQAALDQGDQGKALAAYERIIDADPTNQEAADALRRLKIGLIAVSTHGHIEIGGRYETNVRQQPKSAGREDDFVGFAKLSLNDRRPLFQQDWRTDVFGYADLHDQTSEINYWFARMHTGPTFELMGDATVQIAPGGSVSFLDGDWYYMEPALRVTFENLFGGLLSRLDVRGGYRDINDDFGASMGYALDVVARNVNRDVFTDTDLLVLQPFFRWRDSDNQPAGQPVPLNTFVLGDYVEAGGQLLYYIQPAEQLRIGVKFLAHYRDYEQDIRLGTVPRHDYFISPGAEVMFRNVVCTGCDLRLDYRYERNFSNDDTEDFFNHVLSVSGIKRF